MAIGSGIAVPRVGMPKPPSANISQGHMLGHFRTPHLARFGGKGIAAFDDGGSVEVGAGNSGIAPSTSTQNPIAQSQIQRYQTMNTEQLQELAVRMSGTPQGEMVNRVLQSKRMQGGDQPSQMAAGGAPDGASDQMGEPLPKSGLLHSAVAGRTDHLQVNAPAGSYVIPADVVSGVGEGNTMAGAKFILESLDKMAAPYGTTMPKMKIHSTIPHAPSVQQRSAGGRSGIHINPKHEGLLHHNMGVPEGHKIPLSKLEAAKAHAGPAKMKQIVFAENARHWKHAEGGKTEVVPILGAGGELMVSPRHVAALGRGNLKAGHKMLDAWVVAKRKEIIDEMKKLKPPVKS